jgi:hypothetical protein
MTTAVTATELVQGRIGITDPGWPHPQPSPPVKPPPPIVNLPPPTQGNGMGYPAGSSQSVADFLAAFPVRTFTGTPIPNSPYFSSFDVWGYDPRTGAQGYYHYNQFQVGYTTEYFVSITVHYGLVNHGGTHVYTSPYWGGGWDAPPHVWNYYAPPI